MPKWVLGTFQPREQEWGPPAGQALENTLAESHFSGECGPATQNNLLWQQTALARISVTEKGLLFANSNQEGGSCPAESFRAQASGQSLPCLCTLTHRAKFLPLDPRSVHYCLWDMPGLGGVSSYGWSQSESLKWMLLAIWPAGLQAR